MHKERFDSAILAHGHWKKRLKIAIETSNAELTLKEAKDFYNCPFGQWLHSKDGKKLPQHSELVRVHREFHEEAVVILQLTLQGLVTEAKGRMVLGSRFGQLTAELINKLVEVRDSLQD